MCIDIYDTGIGMSADQVPRAFEAFQLDSTRSSGLGLGLFRRQTGGRVARSSHRNQLRGRPRAIFSAGERRCCVTCPRQPRCRVGRVRNLRQRADVAPGVFAIYPPVVVAVLIGFGDIAVETDAGAYQGRAKPKGAWTHLRGRMEMICGFPAAITPTHLARSGCLTKVRVVQHYPKNGQGEGSSCRGAGWSRMSEADTRLAVRPRRSHIHSRSREMSRLAAVQQIRRERRDKGEINFKKLFQETICFSVLLPRRSDNRNLPA
jgi:hypothetical protein